MAQTNQLTINLSDEALEFVKTRMSTGEYHSESEVIEHELEEARLDEEEQRRWEQEVLIPIHDRLMANPSSAIPVEEVIHNLKARRETRRKAS